MWFREDCRRLLFQAICLEQDHHQNRPRQPWLCISNSWKPSQVPQNLWITLFQCCKMSLWRIFPWCPARTYQAIVFSVVGPYFCLLLLGVVCQINLTNLTTWHLCIVLRNRGRCESGLLLFSFFFFMAKTVYQFMLSPVVFSKLEDYKPEFKNMYKFLIHLALNVSLCLDCCF